MKHVLIVFFFSLIVCFTAAKAFAYSSYVLPYPGIMPGNKLYKIHTLLEVLQNYISFGDFSQFKFNLSEADRYVVESKTLFEYNQYFLAVKSLQKSDVYFQKVLPDLVSAKKHGKNITEKLNIYNQAREKHIEVLTQVKAIVPKTFVWREEKKPAITLHLWEDLQRSIDVRIHSHE